MTDPLESSRYGLEHAHRRIRELESEVAAFGALNPYAERIDKDAKTGEQVLKVKLIKPMPRPWSGIAVDAVGALRSALDQAGFAVALAAGTKGRNGHFPFGGNLADTLLRKIKGRSKDIPQEIFDVMIASQPYRGGNDLLWGLNKLSNTHKHEIIVPLVTSSSGFKMTEVVITGPLTVGARWDSSKNELEVARISPGGKLEGKFTYSFFVAIGDVELVGGQPAIGFLDAVASEVERILMAIEAEARRIGIFN